MGRSAGGDRTRATKGALPAVIAVVVVGLGAVWLGYGFGRLPEAVPNLVAGWTAAACGLLAWWRVPWSGIGPLLVAVGLTWFVSDFSSCLNLEPFAHRCLVIGPVASVAHAGSWLWLGVVNHAVATFPEGHLRTRPQQGQVLAGYVLALAMPFGPVVGSIGLGALLVAGPIARVVRSERDGRPDLVPATLCGIGMAAALLLQEIVPSHVLELALPLVSIGLAGGLLDIDNRRAAMSPDRAVELGGALAVALRDPGLQVVFPMRHAGGWVDGRGRAVKAPTPSDGIEVTRIERGGDLLAAVAHDPATLADPEVRAAVTMAVELEAHNALLRSDLEEQLGQVRASRRRLLDAALRERRELADQVEYQVERPLRALAEEIDGVRGAGGTQVAGRHLDRAVEQLAVARSEVRDLAGGLYPRLLVDRGLASALRDMAMRSPVTVALNLPDGVTGGTYVDATVYFVVAEALANVARHAHASRVRVSVGASDGAIHALVEDDGAGGADAARGSGLRGLRDRVEALAGSLVLDSLSGRGTRLAVTIPVSPEARTVS